MFTHEGEALYLHSSSELQRVTVSAARLTVALCSLPLPEHARDNGHDTSDSSSSDSESSDSSSSSESESDDGEKSGKGEQEEKEQERSEKKDAGLTVVR